MTQRPDAAPLFRHTVQRAPLTPSSCPGCGSPPGPSSSRTPPPGWPRWTGRPSRPGSGPTARAAPGCPMAQLGGGAHWAGSGPSAGRKQTRGLSATKGGVVGCCDPLRRLGVLWGGENSAAATGDPRSWVSKSQARFSAPNVLRHHPQPFGVQILSCGTIPCAKCVRHAGVFPLFLTRVEPYSLTPNDQSRPLPSHVLGCAAWAGLARRVGATLGPSAGSKCSGRPSCGRSGSCSSGR